MGQQELVELVKQLLEERPNKQAPFSNPTKDATVAGHTSMNQESLIQNSQAILQGLAEGGTYMLKLQSLKASLEMKRKTSLILTCGKGKYCQQPQLMQGQPLNRQ